MKINNIKSAKPFPLTDQWPEKTLFKDGPQKPVYIFMTRIFPWVDFDVIDYLKEQDWFYGQCISFNRDIFFATLPEVDIEFNDYKQYETWSYRGFQIYPIIKYELAHTCLSSKPDLDNEQHRTCLEQLTTWCVQTLEWGLEMIEHFDPRAVVVTQGFPVWMRAVVEIARLAGVRTIALENSFLKDYFFCDDTCGAITNRHALSRNYDDLVEAGAGLYPEIHTDQWRDFISGSQKTFSHPCELNRTEISEQYNIPMDKKWILLIGQVMTDAAIIMDSPLFQSMVDFIQTFAGELSVHEDCHLIVRLHPKELAGSEEIMINANTYSNFTHQVLEKAWPSPPPHVSVFQGKSINTYSLMNHCDFAVTLTSQAGLEMSMLHKRVITCGDAFYKHKGFTIDVNKVNDIQPAIHTALDQPGMTDEEINSLNQFMNYLCYRYLISKTRPNNTPRLKYVFR